MSAPFRKHLPLGSATDDELRKRLSGWTDTMDEHLTYWARAREADGIPVDFHDPCDRADLATFLIWSRGWRGPRRRSLGRLRELGLL